MYAAPSSEKPALENLITEGALLTRARSFQPAIIISCGGFRRLSSSSVRGLAAVLQTEAPATARADVACSATGARGRPREPAVRSALELGDGVQDAGERGEHGAHAHVESGVRHLCVFLHRCRVDLCHCGILEIGLEFSDLWHACTIRTADRHPLL